MREAIKPRLPIQRIDFDLATILSALYRRWWILVISLILFTGLASAYVCTRTPLYRATALVVVERQHSPVLSATDPIVDFKTNSEIVDTQVAILKAESLALQVIRALHLERDPEFNAPLRAPKTGSARAGADIGARAAAESVSLPEITSVSERTPLRAAREIRAAITDPLAPMIPPFQRHLNVKRQGTTYAIEVSFDSESRLKAALIANTLAQAYVDAQIEAKTASIEEASEWMGRRLGELRSGMQQAQLSAQEYRAGHGLPETNGKSIVEEQLAEQNSLLSDAHDKQSVAHTKLDAARVALDNPGASDTIPDVIASTLIKDLKVRKADILRSEADVRSRFGASHPDFQQLERERQSIDGQIKLEISNIVRGLQLDAAAADQRVASIDALMKDLQTRLQTASSDTARLTELQSEAQAKTEVFDSLHQHFLETFEQGQIQYPDARILSRANANAPKVFPKKALVLGLALVWSLGFGASLIYGMEAFDPRLRRAKDVEDQLGLPHLGSVPSLSRAKQRVDGRLLPPWEYVTEFPYSAFSESYKRLYGRIAGLETKRNPVVLFTSALPREGKTTSALCLARLMAQSGLRVALIDADMRKPCIGRYVGCKPTAGIAELLSGRAKLEDVVWSDAASGLSVIPVVRTTGFAEILFVSQNLSQLFDRLRSEYDLIVVDSPPVIAVSDAINIAAHADIVVLTVRWQRTHLEAARIAVKMFEEAGIPLSGAVLTDVDLAALSKYGFGDRYHYFRHYGSPYRVEGARRRRAPESV